MTAYEDNMIANEESPGALEAGDVERAERQNSATFAEIHAAVKRHCGHYGAGNPYMHIAEGCINRTGDGQTYRTGCSIDVCNVIIQIKRNRKRAIAQ
jgi:hypothetical protein